MSRKTTTLYGGDFAIFYSSYENLVAAQAWPPKGRAKAAQLDGSMELQQIHSKHSPPKLYATCANLGKGCRGAPPEAMPPLPRHAQRSYMQSYPPTSQLLLTPA